MRLAVHVEKDLYYNPTVHPEMGEGPRGRDGLRIQDVDGQSVWVVKDADVRLNPQVFKEALVAYLPLPPT